MEEQTKRNTTVDFKNFIFNPQQAVSYTLSNLPATETFLSHTSNALIPLSNNTSNNKLTVILPASSVSAVVLRGRQGRVGVKTIADEDIQVFPNPSSRGFNVKTNVDAAVSVYNFVGQLMGTYPKGTQSFGNDWSIGSYMAVFSVDNQVVKMVKLVKE